MTINGHHVLLRDPDENGGSGDPEGGEKPKFTETDYDMKPWGFSHNSEGELTLDNEERERYNTLLIGYETGSGQVIESLSGHAYDRAAQRNISPKEIADALDKSPTTSIESAGCDVYDSESHRVVVDRSAKRIVSVMRRRGI